MPQPGIPQSLICMLKLLRRPPRARRKVLHVTCRLLRKTPVIMAFTRENLLTDVTLRNIDGRQPEQDRISGIYYSRRKEKNVPLTSLMHEH